MKCIHWNRERDKDQCTYWAWCHSPARPIAIIIGLGVTVQGNSNNYWAWCHSPARPIAIIIITMEQYYLPQVHWVHFAVVSEECQWDWKKITIATHTRWAVQTVSLSTLKNITNYVFSVQHTHTTVFQLAKLLSILFREKMFSTYTQSDRIQIDIHYNNIIICLLSKLTDAST